MELMVHRLHPDAKLPEYAHDNDAGMDVFAYEAVVVPARGHALVHLGISFAVPDGYVALIWEKSGLARNHGIGSMGGVIDAGYRGEVTMIARNHTDTDYQFAKGDKVAQILLQKIEHPVLIDIDRLPESERGTGGFGSTGK
jgi:dUTP pyrophosphatase